MVEIPSKETLWATVYRNASGLFYDDEDDNYATTS